LTIFIYIALNIPHFRDFVKDLYRGSIEKRCAETVVYGWFQHTFLDPFRSLSTYYWQVSEPNAAEPNPSPLLPQQFLARENLIWSEGRCVKPGAFEVLDNKIKRLFICQQHII
jgi:hypothetical protein